MTLPANYIEWLWFTFFTVGALGGWSFLGAFAWVVVDEWRKNRKWRK